MFNSKVHKFFTLAKFRNVTNWSVSHILGMNVGFNEKYPMVMIGDIITRSAETINIEDDKVYKQVTLKTNGGGAVQRKDGIKKGKEIGTKKQYIVHTDQFIMSKIDARNGAFGVIGSDLEGSIVTADFPVFDVDKSKVLPEYLKLISSTSRFVEFAKSCSSGTTNRQRIDVNQFMLQKIPLPSLEEQNKFVVAFENRIHRVVFLENQIARIEKQIEEYLLAKLGYISEEYKPLKGIETTSRELLRKSRVKKRIFSFLKISSFKNIDRWDCYSKEVSVLTKIKESPFPVVKLGDFFNFQKRLWNKKEKSFRYIEIGSIDPLLGIMQSEKMPTVKAPSRATQKIENGDLIIGMTRPYLKKFALVGKEYDDCICSSGFQVIGRGEAYNLSFLYEYLKTSLAVEQFELYMSGGLYPAITSGDLQKILIPVPPLNQQNAIVDHINKWRIQAINSRKEAEFLKEKTFVDFEKEIFA